MRCRQATVSKSTRSLIPYSGGACPPKMSENSIYSGVALFVQSASHTLWAILWQAACERGGRTGGNALQSWMVMFGLVSERSITSCTWNSLWAGTKRLRRCDYPIWILWFKPAFGVNFQLCESLWVPNFEDNSRIGRCQRADTIIWLFENPFCEFERWAIKVNSSTVEIARIVNTSWSSEPTSRSQRLGCQGWSKKSVAKKGGPCGSRLFMSWTRHVFDDEVVIGTASQPTKNVC